MRILAFFVALAAAIVVVVALSPCEPDGGGGSLCAPHEGDATLDMGNQQQQQPPPCFPLFFSNAQKESCPPFVTLGPSLFDSKRQYKDEEFPFFAHAFEKRPMFCPYVGEEVFGTRFGLSEKALQLSVEDVALVMETSAGSWLAEEIAVGISKRRDVNHITGLSLDETEIEDRNIAKRQIENENKKRTPEQILDELREWAVKSKALEVVMFDADDPKKKENPNYRVESVINNYFGTCRVGGDFHFPSSPSANIEMKLFVKEMERAGSEYRHNSKWLAYGERKMTEVTLRDADGRHPLIREVQRNLTKYFGGIALGVSLSFYPPRSIPVKPFYSEMDQIIIQIHGASEWELEAPNPALMLPLSHSPQDMQPFFYAESPSPNKARREYFPVRHTLQRGDMLYIPRGVIVQETHSAPSPHAKEEEELSIAYSVGIETMPAYSVTAAATFFVDFTFANEEMMIGMINSDPLRQLIETFRLYHTAPNTAKCFSPRSLIRLVLARLQKSTVALRRGVINTGDISAQLGEAVVSLRNNLITQKKTKKEKKGEEKGEIAREKEEEEEGVLRQCRDNSSRSVEWRRMLHNDVLAVPSLMRSLDAWFNTSDCDPGTNTAVVVDEIANGFSQLIQKGAPKGRDNPKKPTTSDESPDNRFDEIIQQHEEQLISSCGLLDAVTDLLMFFSKESDVAAEAVGNWVAFTKVMEKEARTGFGVWSQINELMFYEAKAANRRPTHQKQGEGDEEGEKVAYR